MTRSISLGVALLSLAAGTADAAVSLPAVLGEHMVVQRELPFHLWGQAAPGETVRASFRGESRSAAADDLGRWSLHLPASAAGGPFTLTVSASNTIRLDDVWVGDVRVAAGQLEHGVAPRRRAWGGRRDPRGPPRSASCARRA